MTQNIHSYGAGYVLPRGEAPMGDQRLFGVGVALPTIEQEKSEIQKALDKNVLLMAELSALRSKYDLLESQMREIRRTLYRDPS